MILESSTKFRALLSYVIQNFHTINPNINLNQKTYLLWLSRNVHIITTYMLRNFNHNLFTTTHLLHTSLFTNLFSLFYSKALFKLVKDLTKKWKSFTSINLNKSLQHFILTQGITLIDDRRNDLKSLAINTPKDTLFLNQYHTSKTMLNINLHGKFYRTVLLKLLISVNSNWLMWNKNYKLTYGFIIPNTLFYNFIYYNHYFFKIYNF